MNIPRKLYSSEGARVVVTVGGEREGEGGREGEERESRGRGNGEGGRERMRGEGERREREGRGREKGREDREGVVKKLNTVSTFDTLYLTDSTVGSTFLGLGRLQSIKHFLPCPITCTYCDYQYLRVHLPHPVRLQQCGLHRLLPAASGVAE